MTAAVRRERIQQILMEADTPISASTFAKQFSVSRQIIVGDIAILRSSGMDICATPRGYIVIREEPGVVHKIVCLHDDGQLAEELNTIVDFGCEVLDVIVDHPVYGELTGQLKLTSRYDVELFVQRVREAAAPPLLTLTDGVHTHTLRCPNDQTFHLVEHALAEKGILLSPDRKES